jgi:hypothetical protein
MDGLMRNAAILAVTLALAACANQFGEGPSQLDPPVHAGLTADEIRNVFSGKNGRWKSSATNLSGLTVYAADGTSLIEVNGKGTTTGTWTTKDGQLCESFAPAAFLPKGEPMRCQPITGSGNQYRVGNADFTLE